MKKKELFLIIILLLIDEGSKFLMNDILSNQIIDVIPGFFKLELAHNTGGSWSILNNNTWILIIISFILLGMLIYMYPTIKETKLKSISFSLLYAGIIGNLLDRCVFGYVRDFLSFNIFGYQYPIFNFADIFIVVGVCLLLIVLFKEEKKKIY